MATPLDVSLLQNFNVVFPFLLVLTIVYAVLGYVKLFNDNKATHGMIAFALAVLTLFSNIVTKTINVMAPWFVLLFFLAIFLLISYQVFGIKQDTVVGVMTGKKYGKQVGFWILAIVLIIFLGSLATVISEEKGFRTLTNDGTSTNTLTSSNPEKQDFFSTLAHPKILGTIVILLIAVFTIDRLAAAPED